MGPHCCGFWRISAAGSLEGHSLKRRQLSPFCDEPMKSIKRAISLLISMMVLLPLAAGATIYFLVGEPPGRELCHDSYVLPLSRQEDIDHARYLISLGRSVF